MGINLPIDEHDALSLKRSIYHDSFYEFAKAGWKAATGKDYVDGIPVEALCIHLQKVTERQIRKLLTNLPPGHGKSTIILVLWVPWHVLVRNQRHDVFCASLGLKLSTIHSEACRDFIESTWFQTYWPEAQIKRGQDTKTFFSFEPLKDGEPGGKRDISSVNADTTGQRGDILIGDDFHDIKDVDYPEKIQRAVKWNSQTWLSRRNESVPGSAVVQIGHRVAHDDVSNWWLEQKDPELVHLNLPFEYDPENHCSTPYWSDPRTEKGEILWPAVYSREWAERKKSEDPQGFETIYNQNPSSSTSYELKPEYFRHEFKVLPVASMDRWALSIDCNFTKSPTSDRVSIQLFGEFADYEYLADVITERMTWLELKNRVKFYIKNWRALGVPISVVLIEKAANGYALIEELQDEFPGEMVKVVGYSPKVSKLARIRSATYPLANAKFFLPEVGAVLMLPNGKTILLTPELWKATYLRVMTKFPNVPHDDEVDATSQWLLYTRHVEELLPPPMVR